jgi:hypothetical protein
VVVVEELLEVLWLFVLSPQGAEADVGFEARES